MRPRPSVSVTSFIDPLPDQGGHGTTEDTTNADSQSDLLTPPSVNRINMAATVVKDVDTQRESPRESR